MINNEAEIIRNCQNGKKADFALLYDGYFKKIYDFVYYKTLHRETAEDLVSRTFIKALKNINQYRSAAGTFSSWLYQIARNNVRDHYRSNKTEANIDDFYDLAGNDNPAVDAANAIMLDKVKEYLNKFKTEQREVVILRLWEGLSFKEIAEIIGKSEANSKMIFARAISKLREGLALVILLIYSLIP